MTRSQATPHDAPPTRAAEPFHYRALLLSASLVGFATLVVVIWYMRHIVLLAFAGLLLAVFLRALAEWLSGHIRLPYPVSLAVVVVGLLTLAGLAMWGMWTTFTAQLDQLFEALPAAAQQIGERLEQYQWSRWLAEQWSGDANVLGQPLFAGVRGAAALTVGFAMNVVIILFVGLYGAARPKVYSAGLVRLFPLHRRNRVREIMQAAEYTLRWWVTGQVIAMIVVAVLTGIGLWLLGIRLALVLALVAGALEIVPFIGPVLAAIPALMIAMGEGPDRAIYVLILYVAVQSIESYILIPLIQQRTVWLPPALTILMILFFGTFAGLLGVFVAAPITAVSIVLIKLIYVKDTLGDQDIKVPGET